MIRAIFYVLAAVLATCSVCHASEIHRVVTGLDANDRSTTLFDNVEPLHAGASGIPSYNILEERFLSSWIFIREGFRLDKVGVGWKAAGRLSLIHI